MRLNVTLPDGSCKQVDAGATAYDVARMIGPGLAKAAVAARFSTNGHSETIDLGQRLPGDCSLSILTRSDDDANSLNVLRHSTAHVMAEAICRLYPQAKLVYGPPVADGFYYDIDLDESITPDAFERIEAEMARIIAEDRPFVRYELRRAEAMSKLAKEGNRYKVDNAERAEGDTLSFYVTGSTPGKDFEDLCRGPHVPSTNFIGAFKVRQVSAAYYRGDAKEKSLQRVYGTAFFKKKSLTEHLERLEKARERDHRVLGKQLGLFTTSAAVGSGMILWMPRGATIRSILEGFLKEELVKLGYEPVYTPHISKSELFETSGHYPHYKESMFPPLEMDGDTYLLKPMNCPFHIQIYKAQPRSYRDLPVRLAEFGSVYRYEQSGEVSGMIRVRGFTQDDAHLFCMPEQLEDELRKTVLLTQRVLHTLEFQDYRVRVGLPDPNSDKYVGPKESWDAAVAVLRRVVRDLALDYTEEPGEAAFYGPKIDFIVKDCIGREWQLGTVQADYNLPERFDLTYVGKDNLPHRPIMIHRAPFGSLERFVGILIEHFAGAFPLWLAPIQVGLVTVSEKSAVFASQVYNALVEAGLRVELDDSSEKIGPKKHRMRSQKIPYILVVGEKEAAANTVNVNGRDDAPIGNMDLSRFLAECRREIASKGKVTLSSSTNQTDTGDC